MCDQSHCLLDYNKLDCHPNARNDRGVEPETVTPMRKFARLALIPRYDEHLSKPSLLRQY